MSYEDPRRKRWVCRNCARNEHAECKGVMGGDQCICEICDVYAEPGTLQNVLDLLNAALTDGVLTADTNPPGVSGLAGQAMTGWVHYDRVEIARNRLAAVIEKGRQHG